MQQPRMGRAYFTPQGSLTQEGYTFFRDLVNAIEAVQSGISTLETTASSHTATLADHETRITALEP